MPDHFYAELVVPTVFIKSANSALRQAFKEQNLDIDDYDDYDELLIELSDSEASNGEFEIVEDELKRQGIPFDRYSGGYHDTEPERVSYRSRTDLTEEQDVCQTLCYSEGDPYVTISDLRKLLDGTSDYLRQCNGDLRAGLQKMIDDIDPEVLSLEDWLKANKISDVIARAAEACKEVDNLGGDNT